MASDSSPHVLDRTGTRLFTGAIGGFLAGVAFIALTSWFFTSMGRPALAPFRVIATIAQGGPPPTTDLWVGMAIHSALSAVFGIVFALLTAMVRSNGTLMAAGVLYGGIIYVIDFQVLARFVERFSVFRMANQPFEVAVHLVFGAVLALFVLRPPQRGDSAQSAEQRAARQPAGAA